MSRRRSILIATQAQFGYHVNTYEYAKHLRRDYEVTFFCWDYGRPRISLPGVRVIYSSRGGGMIRRNLRFRRELLRTVRDGYDRIFLMYFVGVTLVHLAASRQHTVCYLQTARVGVSRVRRLLSDTLTRLEMSTFRHRLMISACLGRKIGLRGFGVLPLGGIRVPFDTRDLRTFRLVYIGTLHSRGVHTTVEGLGRFHEQLGGVVDFTYDIVGSGPDADVDQIREAIARYGLEDAVTLHGYVPHEDAIELLRDCNIGFSYVPMHSFYDCQPPTKTYEYLLAGLVVIATRTKENELIMNGDRGVLIDDDAEAVQAALAEVLRKRDEYDPYAIQQGMVPFEWGNIVDEVLIPYLDRMSDGAVHGSEQTTP